MTFTPGKVSFMILCATAMQMFPAGSARSMEDVISLQKTGYINESGNCLVMRGQIDGRNLIMVLLDSHGRYSRLGDAQRLRRWLEG